MRDLDARYGPWAVVTGATSGIGAAFAEALAGAGLHVVLVARRAEPLLARAADLRHRFGVTTRTLPLDLAAPEGPEDLARFVADLDVGLLVTCAGGWVEGPFVRNDLERELRVLDLNVRSTVELCHRLAPGMVRRGRGGIVLVSSGLGFQGAPYLANYAATKAHTLVFGEGLAWELAPGGVDVLVVTPGPTRTEGTARHDHSALPVRPSEPAAVAAGALRALGRRAVHTPGRAHGALHWIGSRLLPRGTMTRVLGRSMPRVLRDVLEAA